MERDQIHEIEVICDAREYRYSLPKIKQPLTERLAKWKIFQTSSDIFLDGCYQM